MLKSVLKASSIFLISVALVVISFASFIAVGAYTNYWNPGLIGIVLGIGGAGLFLATRLPRFAVLTVIGVLGGSVATMLGPLDGVGYHCAIATVLFGVATLFWKILAEMAG